MSWIIDNRIEGNYEGHVKRRTLPLEDHIVEEEKVGSARDPDYTILRVFDESYELVTAESYQGDGSTRDVAEIDLDTMNEYTKSPLKYLSDIDNEGDLSEEDLELNHSNSDNFEVN